MSIIKKVTLQKIVARDFRYGPRIIRVIREGEGHAIRIKNSQKIVVMSSREKGTTFYI